MCQHVYSLRRIKAITLLVTHEKDLFWVAEEMGDSNIPCRAIIFPITNTKNNLSQEGWEKYFSSHGIWQNLEYEQRKAGETKGET
ncbi:hypothetical protein [Tychonema sp. BBK16]|uniref:hypothetical protein n=1 Tax=Tychonema sp. BBK16 TaxID=2699888 RepID=UPI0038D262CA